MLGLNDRRIVITGGSKGLGRLIAGKLVASGARVAMLARESSELRAAERELGDGAIVVACDLRAPASITSAIAEAGQRLGGIDALINNAGIVRPALLDAVGEDDLLAQIETNLLAVIRVTQAALPYLRASKTADIVNVSSEVAGDPRPLLTVYSAAKAGLEAFSSALRLELRDDRIRVSVLRAGRMLTGTIQEAWQPGVREAFYAAGERSGHAWRSGDFMDPQTVAQVALDLLALPTDATINLVEVRGR